MRTQALIIECPAVWEIGTRWSSPSIIILSWSLKRNVSTNRRRRVFILDVLPNDAAVIAADEALSVFVESLPQTRSACFDWFVITSPRFHHHKRITSLCGVSRRCGSFGPRAHSMEHETKEVGAPAVTPGRATLVQTAPDTSLIVWTSKVRFGLKICLVWAWSVTSIWQPCSGNRRFVQKLLK